MSRMTRILLIILCLGLTGLQGEVQTSWTDQLKLDIENISAPNGLDIWMSENGGASWKLVGKTFRQGEGFIYRAGQAGRYDFYYHSRTEADQDSFKPQSGAKAHQSISVDRLESENSAIQYSNRRRLLIEYVVNDATALTRVDLYYTLNSGLSWILYGSDPDRRSPMEFVANRDGLYGFKVASIDSAEKAEKPPLPGVKPDVMVRVDTAPPKVQLISPQPQDIWEPSTMRAISWVAEDESINIGRCVELEVAIGAPENWQTLARFLPSAGQHIWSIPKSENGKIYIRARAIDRAGNMASSTEFAFFTRNILEDLLAKEVREQADSYYKTATICRINEDYSKAIKYYRLCLQLNPYHVPAHNDCAITLMKMGRQRDALVHFEEGLKYSPSRPDLLSNLARLYLDNRQLDLSRKLLQRLIILSPQNIEGLWLSAQEATLRGEMERARAYWKRILELDMPAESVGIKLKVEAKAQLFSTGSGLNEVDWQAIR